MTKFPVYHGQDLYARAALGIGPPDDGFGDLFVAARGLTESVVPDIDEGCLTVEGPDAEQCAFFERALLERHASRDLWNEPTLPMELHRWLERLIYDGELYVHLEFLQAGDGIWHLTDTSWLSPETMVYRPRQRAYEQFAGKRRFRDPSYYVADGEPANFLASLADNEVLHLRWPLESPGPVPAKAVRDLGVRRLREGQRSLWSMQGQAEPDDPFITLARARSGAYVRSVERQKAFSARIKDMLFYPGAQEAEIFSWIDEVSEYFAAHRILRSRIAIARLREYLFAEINRQLMRTWCERNGWPESTLTLRTDQFDLADWEEMQAQLDAGTIQLQDVKAAVSLEWECGHAYGR